MTYPTQSEATILLALLKDLRYLGCSQVQIGPCRVEFTQAAEWKDPDKDTLDNLVRSWVPLTTDEIEQGTFDGPQQ